MVSNEWLVMTSDNPPWHNKRGLARSFICLPMPARYRRFHDAELNGNDSNSISYAGRPASRSVDRSTDFSFAIRVSRSNVQLRSLEISSLDYPRIQRRKRRLARRSVDYFIYDCDTKPDIYTTARILKKFDDYFPRRIYYL